MKYWQWSVGMWWIPWGGQKGARVVGIVGAVGIVVPWQFTLEQQNAKNSDKIKTFSMISPVDFQLQTGCLRIITKTFYAQK